MSKKPNPQLVLNHLYLVTLCLFVAACSSNKNPNPLPNKEVVSGSLICHNPAAYAGKVVGDGHCVSLIKQCSGAPDTRFWRPGKNVLSGKTLASGTIIATFKNGRYPNISGYHAAIYIKHNKEGIWVWDQWRGKAVHKRFIRVRRDGASSNNTAQDYRIVELN